MTRREVQEKRLAMYLEAEEKILLNQSYTVGNRTYVRADLGKIQSAIAELEEALSAAGARRRKHAVFVDK